MQQCTGPSGTYYVDGAGNPIGSFSATCYPTSSSSGGSVPPGPVCTGTLQDVCSGLSATDCGQVRECAYGSCSGEACTSLTDQYSCTQGGCLWAASGLGTGDCGTATLECASLTGPTTCAAAGCSWSGQTGACGVSVSSCSSLLASDCASVAGCTLVGDSGATAPSGALIELKPNESAQAIIADGTNVYAMLSVPAGTCAARWMSVPRDGSSPPVTIWSGTACGAVAAVDASDQLFWSQGPESSAQLMAVPKAGGAAINVGSVSTASCPSVGANCDAPSIAADATGYYWAVWGIYESLGTTGYSCTGSYVAGALRSQASVVLSSGEQCAEVIGDVNGSVFWWAIGNGAATESALRSSPSIQVDGGTTAPSTIATWPGGGPAPYVITDGRVFAFSGSEITATPLGPGASISASSTVVAKGITNGLPLTIAAHGGETAWIQDMYPSGAYQPAYAPASTGTPTLVSTMAIGLGIAVDDTNVYYATGNYVVATRY